MNLQARIAVTKLIRAARKQVRHHGHCCGFGNFPKRGKLNSYNRCPICDPTDIAIKEVTKIMRREK